MTPSSPARQPLGTERRVRERHHRTLREAPVQLVERRRAEPRPDISPDRQPIVNAIQRADPRTAYRVFLIREDGVADGARRQRRLGVVCVVVAPAVEPGARRHREVRHRHEHVLHKHSQRSLRAAGDAVQRLRRAGDRVERILDAVAVDPAKVGACGEHVRAEDAARPLHRAAEGIGRHGLVQRQASCRARARRIGDRQEVAVERLRVAEDRRLQSARVGEPRAHPAARVLPRGVVQFLGQRSDCRDLAVVPVLVEIAGPDEGVHAIVRVVVGLERHVAELHRHLGVHGAPQRRKDVRIAVRVEDAAVHRNADLAPDVAAPEVELGAVPASVLRLDIDRSALGCSRDDVQHAAHGIGAVQAGAGAVHHFDALGALHRQRRPVHPASERVVERHAVEEHETAAHAARPDAAERHALTRRMR